MTKRYSYSGYDTVHTGNKPHKPTSPEQRERAQEYGLAHGFKGDLGGWIYDKNGQHVAHGWGQFYHLYASAINRWCNNTNLA